MRKPAKMAVWMHLCAASMGWRREEQVSSIRDLESPDLVDGMHNCIPRHPTSEPPDEWLSADAHSKELSLGWQ